MGPFSPFVLSIRPAKQRAVRIPGRRMRAPSPISPPGSTSTPEAVYSTKLRNHSVYGSRSAINAKHSRAHLRSVGSLRDPPSIKFRPRLILSGICGPRGIGGMRPNMVVANAAHWPRKAAVNRCSKSVAMAFFSASLVDCTSRTALSCDALSGNTLAARCGAYGSIFDIASSISSCIVRRRIARILASSLKEASGKPW